MRKPRLVRPAALALPQHPRRVVALAVSQLLEQTAGGGAGQGKRIQVGNKSGTILEDTGKLIKIHFDNSGYSPDVGVWFDKADLNKSSNTGGTAPAAASGTINGATTKVVTPVSPGSTPTRTGGTTAIQQPATPYEPAEKGVGAPPDGIYTCNKISGRSYIHIGTIEIRGRTYKGFSSQQGSFRPFTLDGSGNIIWTGGLTSLPAGWTLKPGKYVGPDYKGHPLIRVYYTSDRGAAEVIDATKEK